MNQYTEAEAGEKWCPFARIALLKKPDGLPSEPVANRWSGHGNLQISKCLGSGCTAWRWHSEGEGYCGLAGLAP